MPIRGIVDLQRESLPIGEIRNGTSVAVPGKDYRKPVRLETFRFTTASESAAEAVAETYGGTVAPWSRKKGRFEVTTDRDSLRVWVPPRGLAVDANMELWDGPRRRRKCDGITMEFPSRQPCQCPRADDPSDPECVQAARDERKRLAAMRPPQACKPLTRINVSITELPGLLGVWKLSSGSEYAARETADSGDAMALARAKGAYLPADLRIEWRNRALDGSPFPVPVLHIDLSMQRLAEGALPAGPGGLLAQLVPAADRRALPAGSADGAPASPAALPVATPEPAVTDDDYMEPWQQATRIAQIAREARSATAFRAIADEAKRLGLMDEQVCTDKDKDEWTDLQSVMEGIWADKAAQTAGAA